jgi:hypothetical protein
MRIEEWMSKEGGGMSSRGTGSVVQIDPPLDRAGVPIPSGCDLHE